MSNRSKENKGRNLSKEKTYNYKDLLRFSSVPLENPSFRKLGKWFASKTLVVALTAEPDGEGVQGGTNLTLWSYHQEKKELIGYGVEHQPYHTFDLSLKDRNNDLLLRLKYDHKAFGSTLEVWDEENKVLAMFVQKHFAFGERKILVTDAKGEVIVSLIAHFHSQHFKLHRGNLLQHEHIGVISANFDEEKGKIDDDLEPKDNILACEFYYHEDKNTKLSLSKEPTLKEKIAAVAALFLIHIYFGSCTLSKKDRRRTI